MLAIRLLGPPALERDGAPVPSPRGRKAWALLAYLVLAERPPGRQHLAELLFADAADPLGALRWTLAELRRALGVPGALRGDPVAADLGPDAVVDVLRLADGDDVEWLLAEGGRLLDGVDPASGPEFESWLSVARHRTSAGLEARLRETAVRLLATGRAADAVRCAARAVESNPFDEGNHELLVRGLAMAGDPAAARRQVGACEDLFRRELGVEPSPALREAAGARPGSAGPRPLGGRAAAESQLDAGRAAIAAGAVDAGVQCLRLAVVEAARCRDDALHARTLAALGGALVHAVRGHDEEGAVVLHEAIGRAARAGDRATTVTAYRELGFVEVQAGRRATGERWLTEALSLAETDAERAAILGVRGMNASDRADYPSAFAHLGASVEHAARCGDQRQQAWSLSLVARAHLLRGEHRAAETAVAASLALVQEQRWMAFLPWPQALRAELDLLAGDAELAADGLERAWSLACQLGDPCWEGMAARGLGLLHSGRGDQGSAREWLDVAVTRCSRVPDRYQWVRGYVLDATITTTGAEPLVTTLETLAARCDMREFSVRSRLHRHHRGDPTALASARLLAADIDNPALTALLTASTTGSATPG